eukprot:m.645268 g.645268  ORF g.645268 m.645268 type:complete len:102 (+) comp58355_c0_seq10:1-306(+)
MLYEHLHHLRSSCEHQWRVTSRILDIDVCGTGVEENVQAIRNDLSSCMMQRSLPAVVTERLDSSGVQKNSHVRGISVFGNAHQNRDSALKQLGVRSDNARS